MKVSRLYIISLCILIIILSVLCPIIYSSSISKLSSLGVLNETIDRIKDDNNLTQACASITDCNTCYNTVGCHYCLDDNECHAIGSWYGCTWGASCDDLPQCKRNTPQYYAIGSPQPGLVLGLLFACGLLFFVFLLGIHFLFYGCMLCRVLCGRHSIVRHNHGDLIPETLATTGRTDNGSVGVSSSSSTSSFLSSEGTPASPSPSIAPNRSYLPPPPPLPQNSSTSAKPKPKKSNKPSSIETGHATRWLPRDS